MKLRILTGVAMMLSLLVATTGCDDDDDDFKIYNAKIITTIESTGISVTSTGATITGIVKDLSTQSTTAYAVGVAYGTTDDSSSATKVTGSLGDDGYTVTAELTGLTPNVTYYYWTYVTLQSNTTYYSESSSFVTTDGAIATADAASVSEVGAKLSGTFTLEPSESDVVVKAFRISLDEATVAEDGRIYESADTTNSFAVTLDGLAPGLTYYFVAYATINSEVYQGEVKSFTTETLRFEFVDMGLSVDWATFNIGASESTKAGGLFGYGDVSLFNTSTNAGDYASEDIQATEYDIAYLVNVDYMTPTQDNWEELIENTTQTYSTTGITFTASNGNSIFLPFTGSREGEEVTDEDTFGAYWSATIDEVEAEHAIAVAFSSEITVSGADTYKGLAIRPVRKVLKTLSESNLFTTWKIDLDTEGNCQTFVGPLYYYGTDDGWYDVTNGLSAYDCNGDGKVDSWGWEANYAENTWIVDTLMDYGTMTFNSDYTYEVVDNRNSVTYTGTFTVTEDENGEYTLSLSDDGEILHLMNFDELVTDWSNVRIFSAGGSTLQLGVIRDNSDEGECYLVHNYVAYSGVEQEIDNTKILIGDLEDNGNFRIEIYNAYGNTSSDPGVSTDFTFSSNLAVTWTISGVTLNDGAVGQYDAVMSFASSDWGAQYWGGTPKFDALVTGDGTYTNFVEVTTTANGATVWVIDILNMATDIADLDAVSVTIDKIVTDQPTKNLYTTLEVDNDKLLFVNKDGNEQDGRIEIYNLYGDTSSDPAVNIDDISFEGRMTVTFTISGIDGNTNGNYSSYSAALSYSDPDWWPSWWGGSVGSADVTGDGTYTVYGDTKVSGEGLCESAVVFTIELYDLWVDLIDTSAISVTIDEVTMQTAD